MDITIDLNDYVLNMRTAGLLIQNGKILFHKNINKPHYCLIGGRIQIGEDSITALKREVLEELGKDVVVDDVAIIVENFFTMNNKKYHEILFVHNMQFTNEEDKLIEHDLEGIEKKEYMRYMWIKEKDIDTTNICPKGINKILNKKDDKIRHIILKN